MHKKKKKKVEILTGDIKKKIFFSFFALKVKVKILMDFKKLIILPFKQFL